MQNIGVVTVLILLAAFALERVGAAAGFLIPEATDKWTKWRKVAIFAITGAVACAIVQLSNDVRILRYLQQSKPDPRTDAWRTCLVLVPGGDQVKTVAGWLASAAASRGEAPVAPIRVVMDKAA